MKPLLRPSERRLAAVVAQIEGDTLADVACDHGKIGAGALEQKRVSRVLFGDISEKSLEKARALCAERGLSERAAFYCCDGFRGFREDFDVCAIAGLGAYEIVSILAGRTAFGRRYVLVPHTDAHVLRGWLADNGFRTERDFIVREGGIFYTVIVCVETGDPRTLSLRERYLGGSDPDEPDYRDFAERARRKLRRIVPHLADTEKGALCAALLALLEGEKEWK